MNITIIYPHKRKTKSSTYGIAQMVLDRLLSGGTLHEFYLPQDMPSLLYTSLRPLRRQLSS